MVSCTYADQQDYKISNIILLNCLTKSFYFFASVAQWIEHPPPKGRVVGSIPTGGAIFHINKNNYVTIKII